MVSALAFVTLAIAGAAHAAPPPLDAYGDLPQIEDAAVSPDGRHLASIVQSKGERRILVLDPAGELLVAGNAGDSKVRAINWADDNTVLVSKSATVTLGHFFTTPRLELSGTIMISLAGGASGMIFDKQRDIADVVRGNYGIRTVEGRSVGYFGGIALQKDRNGVRFKHGRTTLYAVDLATNRARVAARPATEDHYSDWLIDAAGNVSVTLDVSTTNGDWWIKGPDGNKLAQGQQPTGGIGLVAFGQQGQSVIYSIADEEGNTRWFEVPLGGGETQEFLANTRIERLYVDRNSSQVLGYRGTKSDEQTQLYDPVKHSAVTRIFRAFKGRQTRLIDWTADFSTVLVRTSGNGDSGTWYIVDVKNRRADPLGAEREAIPPEQVGPISVVNYKAQDGLEMDGILTLPPGREAKGLPVIMLPHGGPSSHDEPEFDWWAQAFASRGYAVFQPNFRGSTNRNDAFRRAGYGEWGRKMQSDISDGLAELARQGIVDPKRACIVGASYGGYAALAGVTLQQGLYRCAVSVAGVADVKRMYSTDVRESGDSRMAVRALREELGDPSQYAEISPRRFADRTDAPVLLIHGKDDTVVPLSQSKSMADALKDAGKPYEMVVLDGEDHWLSSAETRKHMLRESVRFVEKHNPAD
ncbi:S9 family peptidase [Novosphingobium sp. YJ-S2-02]|uniref:S9 family peptidase n=2 Tax=Novosphingobium aureum TaxID=2792964 RepID=A0A931HEA5_9SPHN|nr:S9 family peptidase [Novosphingobium aureum]